MRYLVVSLGYHPDVPGGAWRVAAEQATGLAARGHSVEVITAHPGGEVPLAEVRRGVRISRYPQHHGAFYANWREENRAAAALIRKSLAAGCPSTLLIQHHAYLEPAVATAPCRVLHVYHGPWAEEYRYAVRGRDRGVVRRLFDAGVIHIMHRVERRALRRADRILVLSRHFADLLPAWHGRRIRQPEIVPGGVDFSRFAPAPDRDEVRRAWGLTPEDRLLVALRRLDPRMGLDLLIDAFAQVLPAFPHARLWLTGKGSAENALRERIDRLGLAGTVRLLGVLEEDDVPRLLNAADLTLMPSLDLEGFGLATAESLACGTPVLGSRAGATPELLEPLDPRLLFESGSTAAIADALRRVLQDPAQLPPRVECVRYARARFSWERQVLACEGMARDLLGSVEPNSGTAAPFLAHES